MARTEQEQWRLDRTRELYEAVLMPMDKTRVDEFLHPDYIQHSSLAEPGIDALKHWLDRVRVETPDAKQNIRRVFVDGHFTIAHIHLVLHPGDTGHVIADFFRWEGDRIKEHWDVIQEIPENPVNPNPIY